MSYNWEITRTTMREADSGCCRGGIMAQEILKDRMGRVIGRITTDKFGTQTITDAFGRKKGSYSPRENTTRDAFGKPFGQGNLLTDLL